jgi:hypothetical protein
VCGPPADKFSKATVLLSDIKYELSVGLDSQYFLAVANDARVLRKAIDLVRTEHDNFIWRETKEYFLKTIPFVINDAPYKSRLKDATGHLGQPAVIFSLGQCPSAAHCGHHLFQTGLPPMLVTSALNNVFEAFQLPIALAVIAK